MYIGAQRVPVQIWRNAQVGTDDYNNPIVTPVLWKATWAEMEGRRGAEHYTGAQLFALTNWFFTFRYFSVAGIHPAMWIVVNGQRYDIKNIMPDNGHKDNCIVEARVENINMVDGAASGHFALEISLQAAMPAGVVGVFYAGPTPTITGGQEPYTLAADDDLPAGLAINESGGISGTPASAGTSSFNFIVTDALGATSSLPLSIVVNNPGP